MDDGDRAADYAARMNMDAVAAVLRLQNKTHSVVVAVCCEDCGAEIPAARRQAQPGCSRCVECQNIFERLHNGL